MDVNLLNILALLINILIVCLVVWVVEYLSTRFLPSVFHIIVRVVLFIFVLFYLLQLLADVSGLKIGTL